MKQIVVIGGGPAGSVAAAMLAKYSSDAEVLLVEKDRHPRHHVGESLQPATFDILDQHFGLKDLLTQQGYANKFGAVYIWGENREPWRIVFDERLEKSVDDLSEAELLSGGFEQAWQVDRESFDQILFENARNQGVKIIEQVAVQKIELDASHAKVEKIFLANGEILQPDFVVDATGQSALLGRKMGWKSTVEDLKSVAVYGYFQNTGALQGALGRHVQLVVSVPDGWLWFIPISKEITSIGLVTQAGRKIDEAEFLEIITNSELPLGDGELIEKSGQRIFYAKDWSYACRKMVGENFVLVGDAACFVDPILSGGVDFAIRGGANAALAIIHQDRNALMEYEQGLLQEYQAYLRMARYWYGNNRSVQGFFWEAHQQMHQHSMSTPLRAFVYLTSGKYAADRHFKIFQKWQEEIMFQSLGVNKEPLIRKLQQRKKGV